MLRLWDDRTDSLAELGVKASIPLRICVHGPSGGGWAGLADLRVLLVADVLMRTAELHGLQVIAVLTAGSPAPAALDEYIDVLGIHPLAVCTGVDDTETALGGRAHVQLARSTAELGDDTRGLLLRVGAVEHLTCGETVGDPFALRLVMLSHPYRQPVTLTAALLADAAGTLRLWRARVAEWANEPSRPIPQGAAARIRDAFDEDLDTVAAVDLLHSLESDQKVPAGAKFETFVFVDRVLGLELAREIGRTMTTR